MRGKIDSHWKSFYPLFRVVICWSLPGHWKSIKIIEFFLLLVSLLMLSQRRNEPVVGWLNLFVVIKLNQQQPIGSTYKNFYNFKKAKRQAEWTCQKYLIKLKINSKILSWSWSLRAEAMLKILNKIEVWDCGKVVMTS